ncbi:WD and tetratricopeptide repeats protein 1-like isoform X1 [Harmonia axyridis]|uniref:WD and tetratricopeptide repeats protein 1-like isoform X1 n=1 Tax=Harmonia axyridis TaxID=115357 RepID=UPI001E277C16|nr:WD and tetratricopeptide repeats protein 1-like isoform X1 [Harmonia axyridis]
MERKTKKWKNDHDVLKLLRAREVYPEYAGIVQKQCHFTEALLKRLGLEYELKGHQGCVNCLQWSADGRHLASGSDDTNIIYWDPFHHKKLQVIPTPHVGNIFSVKFLDSNDSIIATAAGDCKVIVQNVHEAVSKEVPLLQCSCHIGRVKRLATCPDQPMLFWSAGEDGLVLQYDMREPHDCREEAKVFVDLSYATEVKCIQVNPTNPNHVAVGVNDCFVRLYDRRKVVVSNVKLKKSCSIDSLKRSPVVLTDTNCVQYYSPGHLAKENFSLMNFKLAATYIAFNSAGTEMLVNMGGEQIYLFDVNSTEHINEILIPTDVTSKKLNLYRPCCETMDSSVKSDITDMSTPTCLCEYINRAEKLFQRNWMGDTYAALRDYLLLLQHCPNVVKVHLGLIKCLVTLKWSKEANEWAKFAIMKFPELKDSKDYSDLCGTIKFLSADKNGDGQNKIDPQEKVLRQASIDYRSRYVGHCNTTTDIKEVNFLGEQGNYLCAGSDEGVIFIWDKYTGDIVNALWGDVSIVNCIQPHPTACFIASSGIDPVVKLWSPEKENGEVNTRLVKNLPTVVEDNQQRMSVDPFETMLASMGYRLSNQFYQGQIGMSEVPTCRTS